MGGSSSGKGGSADIFNLALNPVGLIGKVGGYNLDPIGGMMAATARAPWEKFAEGKDSEEIDWFGDSFLSDIGNPIMGGLSRYDRQVYMQNKKLWEEYNRKNTKTIQAKPEERKIVRSSIDDEEDKGSTIV